ncbi:MAG TPA: hypothetical protein VMV18_15970, partial [bacterium]|nr:hypothetical protein [bacterium]
MDCGLTRSELVPFHFGECAPDLRAPLEQHLLACRECLTAYLELKRALESEPARAPSRLAHARLRAAVAAEIAHRAPRPA